MNKIHDWIKNNNWVKNSGWAINCSKENIEES
jgi:hypothetical protein